MLNLTALKDNPGVRRGISLIACAVASSLAASADFNGFRIPLNTALSAALPPAFGIAVLAGSLFTYALTGWLTKEPVLLCALALTVMLRWILGVSHTPRAAAMVAATGTLLSAIVFGMARLITGKDLLLLCLSSAVSGLLALCVRKVLSRFEGGLPVRLHTGDTLPFSVCYMLGAAALCSVKVSVVSFGVMLSVFVILTAAKSYRTRGGVLCGTLSAAALLLADSKTSGYAAVLPAAGLAAGFLAGKRNSLLFFVMQVAGLLGLTLAHWDTPTANAWVSGMIGGLIFLFLPAPTIADAVMKWNEADTDLAALTEARMDFMSQSIAGVRGSAERIAHMLAKSEPPEDAAEKVYAEVCEKCSYREACWERAGDETKKAFRQLSDAGLAEPLTAPFGCLRPDLVTGEFTRMKRQNAVTRTLTARLRESQSLLFSQLRITEELLRNAGKQSRRSYHRELTRYVTDILEKHKIPLIAAAVSEGENKRLLIELYLPANDEADTQMIAECLTDALQRPLEISGTETAGDEHRIMLRTAGGFTVSTAAAQCAVHEDEPCGDCWDTFSDSRGAFYLAVSDGMGTGKNAAVDARIVLTSFRQLVQSGMDCKAAAKMINAIMLTKSGDERFATLDVAKISTDTADVTLYKYGAGPTFIRHGDRITLFQAATNPIGILPAAEPYITVMKLERGDMLFLLTDGLDDGLFPFVRQQIQQGGDLQALAHAVCAKAQRSGGGSPPDDITVLAAAISEAAVDA